MENGDALLQAAGYGEELPVEPQVAPVPQEVQPAPTQPAPQIPQFDPSLFVGALENIHTRLDGLGQQQQPQMPKAPPTEEELIIQQLAEKMGLGGIKQENEQLKQMLEQTKTQTEQMQAFIQKQQIEAVQNQIIGKYQGVTKDMVQSKLQELAGQYGEQFATSLNNPQGWEYIISTQIQKPSVAPDPIVSSSSGSADFTSSAAERIKTGSHQSGDIGELLASYLK